MQSTNRRKRSLLSNFFEEHGQDLVEYALLIALIAFGATAAMKSLAKSLNTTFTNVGSQMTAAPQPPLWHGSSTSPAGTDTSRTG